MVTLFFGDSQFHGVDYWLQPLDAKWSYGGATAADALNLLTYGRVTDKGGL